jgi:phenylalanyl-tRNA synthetase beta chain
MKFSYNWIREFVNGLDAPAESLERLITIKTAECEGVERVGSLLEEADTARVLAVEPIEGSKNVKATVDAGRYGRRVVVCGAPNCRPGVVTVYVPLGIRTIAGIGSDGMLASPAELDINKDHSGIVELASEAGAPMSGCVPDSIIEIDNKSLTHRPDLWGHHGMAREVAAITGKKLREPAATDLLPAPGGPVEIEIEDLGLCPRYSALVFENVKVKPSPLWLQYRLTSIGLNPINNIVDLTNFIMAELAQPMHAFDRVKLSGNTIWARPGHSGERIVALNDEAYSLGPSNLVIADAAGPIAIAGVIGGRDSAISESTVSIVLESANFQAASIRKTSAALKLRTDASMRFEKSQDPRNTVRALARALELMPEISPGARLAGGIADRKAELPEAKALPLDLDWLARKLGRAIGAGEVKRILESLEFGVEERAPRLFSVRVPSWRATKDVALPDDLVEEVGRMIGYDSIDPQPPLVTCKPSYDPPEREFIRQVKRMVAAQGFTEVSNYSFVSEEEARRFGFEVEEHVRVLNPIAAGQELLRTSLLPGIYRNIGENAKHFDSFRIFEIGREIHRRNGDIPRERLRLAAAMYSKEGDGCGQLLELKRSAECLASGLRITPAEPRTWEHPARCVSIWWNGHEIGSLGELHPALVENGRAAVLDLDLESIRELTPERASYRGVRKFPTSAFDLSIVCGARELAGDLELEIRRFGGDLTGSVDYIREYQGPPLAEGRKSVSFRVVVGAADKTLSSAEVAEVRNRMIDGLSRLGYELRV